MKQTEAVIEALKILGGKSTLRWITLIAQNIIGADWSKTKTPDASIRRIVRNTPEIVALGNAQYELQEHIDEIEKLRNLVAEKDREIERLKAIPTEDVFVCRLVKETKHFFKHNREKADAIRQIMIKVDRPDAESELDIWMEGRERDSAKPTNNFLAPVGQVIGNVERITSKE